MKASTVISIIVVLFFSFIAMSALMPNQEKSNFIGYKQNAARKIIVTSKTIRQGGSSTYGSSNRSYSGGGSSYGK